MKPSATVHISCRNDAGIIAASRKIDAWVAFGSSVPRGFAEHRSRKIHLPFDDLSGPTLSAELSGYVACTHRDIRALVGFLRSIDPAESVLINCAAGISRSTAAAYIYLCETMGEGHEPAALAEVIRLRPIATPNSRMVEFADVIMGRGGAMVDALEVSSG